jgi:hypothetical protein
MSGTAGPRNILRELKSPGSLPVLDRIRDTGSTDGKWGNRYSKNE